MSGSDLLTTDEREQERDALELVLAGATGALEILPEASAWRSYLLDMKTGLAERLKLYDEDES